MQDLDDASRQLRHHPVFAGMDDDAAKLAAARLRSAKDLGWTGPPLRRGGTRPRHRAYGGTTELPRALRHE